MVLCWAGCDGGGGTFGHDVASAENVNVFALLGDLAVLVGKNLTSPEAGVVMRSEVFEFCMRPRSSSKSSEEIRGCGGTTGDDGFARDGGTVSRALRSVGSRSVGSRSDRSDPSLSQRGFSVDSSGWVSDASSSNPDSRRENPTSSFFAGFATGLFRRFASAPSDVSGERVCFCVFGTESRHRASGMIGWEVDRRLFCRSGGKSSVAMLDGGRAGKSDAAGWFVRLWSVGRLHWASNVLARPSMKSSRRTWTGDLRMVVSPEIACAMPATASETGLGDARNVLRENAESWSFGAKMRTPSSAPPTSLGTTITSISSELQVPRVVATDAASDVVFVDCCVLAETNSSDGADCWLFSDIRSSLLMVP